MANQERKPVHIVNTMGDAALPRGEPETVQPVHRALAIVELLRAAAPLMARDVAAGAGLNRTTAHRLLDSLHRRGWIDVLFNNAGGMTSGDVVEIGEERRAGTTCWASMCPGSP